MVFVAESAPPAEGVKPKVTGTPALFTALSLLEILNSALVTAPTMFPDGKFAASK